MPTTPSDHYAPAPRRDAVEAARERAIALLTDRYADDTLTEAEFEARLGWLSRVDRTAEIEALVTELSVARPPAATPSLWTPALPFAEERLLAVMSSTRRTGSWTLPGRLSVRAVMSELRLDLRFATLPAVGEIHLRAVMANVRLIVPPEVSVECRISPFMGTVTNDAGEAPWLGYGAPKIVVDGSCVMSEVRIDVKARGR